MSTAVPLSRCPHLRPTSTLASTSSSLLSAAPPCALLVAHAYDANLRRAGLEMIQRAAKAARRGSAVARSKGRPTPPTRAAGTTVELHVLILGEGAGAVDENDDDENRRSMILAQFRAAGATVHHHLLPVSFKQLSLSTSASTALASLSRTLSSGTLGAALDRGLAACAFVHARGDEDALRAFMEGMAEHYTSLASASSAALGSITLFLPRHPFLSDFDLDLPSAEVPAVRVVRTAAAHFTAAVEARIVGAHHERRRSAEALLATGTDANRRHSLAAASAPESSGASPSAKPLLLRPAPGAGPASLAMRLSVDTGAAGEARDVVLRVAEAQTPTRGPDEGLRPLLLRPPAVRPRSPSPTPSSSSSSSSSAAGSLRSIRPPPRAAPGSPPKLRLAIPSLPPPTPLLVSSFSPDSASDAEPRTPATAAFQPHNYSPLCKLPRGMPERSETTRSWDGKEGWSPVSREVRALLQMRVRRGECAAGGARMVAA